MAASFRFKRFSVRNDLAALKVGTDAVLLGAAMTLKPGRLLDIGTGTGVIALMAAQRLASASKESGGTLWGEPPHQKPSATAKPWRISAIDIDSESIEEARLNFADSPWAEHLVAGHCALKDFCPDGRFDHIFSNPPFYDNSLTNPDAREAAARHTQSLSYRDICAFASEYLEPDGHISLILPADQETAIMRTAASFGFYPFRIIRISTTPRKPVKRLVIELQRTKAKTSEESLVLQDGAARSAQYAELTREFYL